MIQEWFWGTTLSKDAKEYLWTPTFSEIDESCTSVDTEEAFEKNLMLSSVVVSPDATNGEVQEIEIVTKDSNEKDVVVTVAVLVAGSLYQTPLSVELPQVMAIIRLKRGDGPVHLAGKEFLARDGDPEVEAEEEELEEESEAEEVEKEVTNDSSIKAVHKVDAKKRKKPEYNGKPTGNASARAKRTKLETKHNSTDDDPEDDEMEDEDEEELDETDEGNSEEELPPAKAKRGKKVLPVKKVPLPVKASKPALVKKVPVGGVKKTAKAKA